VSTATPPEPATTVATTADEPMTVKLVGRLGRAIAGSGLSRRRFLSRAAVVGAAVAVDPIRYVLKPGSAYAQVCGDGASCGSGWTAFCCTVNNGANTCPSGSYVAGWWRIDDSPFCLGAARYVIDCNRSPNASCSCRCASGSCDQRRVCCNNFRYGQCNTQVPGVTEVVCRVVTCTAPWVWDPACNRTVRVDNRTRSHNAPCLPGRNATPIDLKYQDMGQSGSILGSPTSAEGDAGRGGRFRRYENGTIFWRSNLGANALHGRMNSAHRSTGGASGPLGFPTMDVRGVGDGSGLHVRFERGSLYQTGASATPVPVYDPVDRDFRDRGGPRGSYGYPAASERRSDGSTLTRFANGILAAVAGRPVVATNPSAYAVANASSAPAPDRVGWPIAAEQTSGNSRYQRYERGIVTQGGSGWVAVGQDLADRYLAAGGPGGSLGRPTGAPTSVASGRGRALLFSGAGIYVGGGAGAQLLTGAIWQAYQGEGGPNGRLGLPTSEAISLPNGQTRASFEAGAIIREPGGSTSVLMLRSGRAPSQLQRTTPDGTAPRGGRSPGELS
jgi:hypothetical protein